MTNAMAPMDTYAAPPEPAGAMTQLGTAQTYTLRRRGARPLVFHGTELAMAMSFSPELPYWYEINIYRTGAQQFALAIRLFYQSEDQRDRADAWAFGSLEEVLAHLESHDAGRDVPMAGDWPSADAPPAELAAASMRMQAEVAAARQHFSGLVGELLSEIDSVADSI